MDQIIKKKEVIKMTKTQIEKQLKNMDYYNRKKVTK